MNHSLSSSILAEQRPLLFRFALLQLHDASVCDDMVQETLLAALQSKAEFVGKSSLTTWLIGILKHKIADYWRGSQHEVLQPLLTEVREEQELEGDDDYFVEDGHWTNKPKTWADPESCVKQIEFWAIYEFCQSNLPPMLAKVFMLRELVGLETSEVCAETGITEANYWVSMHRARLRLRECLEQRWFNNVSSELNHA